MINNDLLCRLECVPPGGSQPQHANTATTAVPIRQWEKPSQTRLVFQPSEQCTRHTNVHCTGSNTRKRGGGAQGLLIAVQSPHARAIRGTETASLVSEDKPPAGKLSQARSIPPSDKRPMKWRVCSSRAGLMNWKPSPEKAVPSSRAMSTRRAPWSTTCPDPSALCPTCILQLPVSSERSIHTQPHGTCERHLNSSWK